LALSEPTTVSSFGWAALTPTGPSYVEIVKGLCLQVNKRGISTLREFRLSGIHINSGVLIRLAAICPHLAFFQLTQCDFEEDFDLCNLEACRELATIHLLDYDHIDNAQLKQLSFLPALTSLSLRCRNFPHNGLRELQTCSQLTSLTLDFILHNWITDVAIQELAALPGLISLTLKNSCNLTGVNLKNLAALPKLTYLDLSKSTLTDVTLGEVTILKNLTVLNLRGCRNLNNAALRRLYAALPKVNILR
jgi:hypothetical protein